MCQLTYRAFKIPIIISNKYWQSSSWKWQTRHTLSFFPNMLANYPSLNNYSLVPLLITHLFCSGLLGLLEVLAPHSENHCVKESNLNFCTLSANIRVTTPLWEVNFSFRSHNNETSWPDFFFSIKHRARGKKCLNKCVK